VAAAFDLAFDAYGYALTFSNNLFTALSGVYLKKASSSLSCSKTAILFYNSLFSLLALLAFYGVEHILVFGRASYLRGRSDALGHHHTAKSSVMQAIEHEAWRDQGFVAVFAVSAAMGSVLNYSIFLCTTYNSALTTAVVGCLKNVLTTYVSMLVFSGYTFNWLNFVGINISVVASLYYTYVTLK
jgi:solute carrier family 35 protein